MATVLYSILFAALLAAVIVLPRRRATRRFGLVLLALILMLEVYVCNFHTFRLSFGDYETVTYPSGSEGMTLSTAQNGTVTAEIRELSMPVGTVFLQCRLEEDEAKDFKGTPYVNVTVDAMDSTQQGYYRYAVAEGQIVRGDDRSAYLSLSLSGDVTALRIRMTPKSGGSLRFEGLTLNQTVPLRLSPLRLSVIFFAVFAIYALLTFPSMKKTYGESPVRRRLLAFAMTAALILSAVAITALYQYDRTEACFSTFDQTSGNQITQELVDAFEAGQVELLDQPPQELLELENPYDWSQRNGISYKWDHLLFDGKYYSYYGIAPVILLFLPYHLLTGYYFPTPEAVLLFGALGILFLTLAYLAFCDLFAKKIPLGMALTGLFICQVGSGVWFNFCSPLFYEIAQTSGFCFTCLGFWLLLRSGVLGKDTPLRLPLVCLSSVCLSLAVLCRPTLALYCVAALFFLFVGFRKRRRSDVELATKQKRRRTLSYLLASLLPFVVIGGVQMVYNHARFGSVLDFGIQYSLTINDFTRAEYHTELALVAFHNFLFAFPSVRPEFPYVFANFSDLAVNGYYFIANRYAIGLFFTALPTWGYLAAAPACGCLTAREKKQAIPLVAVTCVLAPLIIMFSIWESGYSVRYCTDFAWEMILGGIAILFLLYQRRADGQVKRLLHAFFVVSAVVVAVCNFGLVWDYMSKSNHLEAAYLRFARLFDFWI